MKPLELYALKDQGENATVTQLRLRKNGVPEGARPVVWDVPEDKEIVRLYSNGVAAHSEPGNHALDSMVGYLAERIRSECEHIDPDMSHFLSNGVSVYRGENDGEIFKLEIGRFGPAHFNFTTTGPKVLRVVALESPSIVGPLEEQLEWTHRTGFGYDWNPGPEVREPLGSAHLYSKTRF